MDWLDLSEDRDQWRALVNTAMNPRGPTKVEEFESLSDSSIKLKDGVISGEITT
jgi:hypothetical protein